MEKFLDLFLKCGTLFEKDSERLIIGYGTRTWSAEPLNTSPCWYFPDFFLRNKTPWFSHQFWEIVAKEDFLKRLPDKGNRAKWQWENSELSIFERSFGDLKKSFASQGLQKAVPYLFHSCSFVPSDETILQMLKASLSYANNTALQHYGFWEEGEGILGATPEILFGVEAERFKTMACAGTLAKDQKITPEEEAKLFKEHRFVIDGILDAIASFGPSTLVGETKWHTFQHLKHLLTPIEMSLNHQVAFEELVTALHPTAAVGTYPKESGNEWLESFDGLMPRSRFGAPCACVFHGKTLCLVAIRNVQWDNDGMRIGAGSGVIEESDLAKEINEIELKIAAIKRMLQL